MKRLGLIGMLLGLVLLFSGLAEAQKVKTKPVKAPVAPSIETRLAIDVVKIPADVQTNKASLQSYVVNLTGTARWHTLEKADFDKPSFYVNDANVWKYSNFRIVGTKTTVRGFSTYVIIKVDCISGDITHPAAGFVYPDADPRDVRIVEIERRVTPTEGNTFGTDLVNYVCALR